MSGAEIVALASVIVTGLVAPYLTGLYGERRFGRERRAERARELRDLVEAGAERLTLTLSAAGGAVAPWQRSVPATEQNAADALTRYREELEASMVLRARLALHLGGDHPLVRHYRDAHDALIQMGLHLNAYAHGGELTAEHDAAMTASRDAFAASDRQYLEHARALVSPAGARLLADL